MFSQRNIKRVVVAVIIVVVSNRCDCICIEIKSYLWRNLEIPIRVGIPVK